MGNMTVNIKDIVAFFLDVFRRQMGDPRLATDYSCVETQPRGDCIFELRVKQIGRWATRRITVGPLGEESGSKSKCFKVIYDDLLVVKIPPNPITDFEKYIQGIHAEQQIADRLSPEVECIVPSVSALLKKLPPFCDEPDLGTDAFEEKCRRWLKNFPDYQRYLKIGRGFAYFMNLSRYSFLSSIISQMHNHQSDLKAEILKQTDILENVMEMENSYGGESATVIDGLQEAYALYDEKLSGLLREFGPDAKISPYQKREWFVRHLAWERIQPDPLLPPELIEKANRLIYKIFKYHKAYILDYREMVENQIRWRVFNQNRGKIQGIVANLMDLLAKLRDAGVAMRDLKPDNVFIVGDVSESPFILAEPAAYSIGLIDFETSVIFDNHIGIWQPMLACTPSYATPSHVFKNEVLEEVFESLPHVLHLQDWQAVASMIYATIVGERLAKKTGRLLPEIVQIIKRSIKQSLPPSEVFRDCSQTFWSRAVREYKYKIQKNRPFLQATRVHLTKPARDILRQEVVSQRADIIRRVQKYIRGQQIFKSEKSHNDLIKASRETITRLRINWEEGTNVPRAAPFIREQILKFLSRLDLLKEEYEENTRRIEALQDKTPVVSADMLLQSMFEVVLNTMYKAKWGEPLMDDDTDFEADDDDEYPETVVAPEETVMFEKTISQEGD